MIGCEFRLVLPAAATRAPPAAGVAAAGVELAVFLRDLVLLELNMLGSSNARVHARRLSVQQSEVKRCKWGDAGAGMDGRRQTHHDVYHISSLFNTLTK